MNIAIVTGGSTGLGKVYADKIAEKYPKLDEIWLIARRTQKMDKVAAAHPERKFRILTLDLATDESYEELANVLEECKPNVKILINNAGYCYPSCQSKIPAGDILQMINVDVKGSTMVMKKCLPYMDAGSFAIIVGSIASFTPQLGNAVYCACKLYEKFFSLALHEEMKKKGVNVLYMAPGGMTTEMLAMSTDLAKDHGSKFAHLPMVDLNSATDISLRKAESGKRFYTPILFNKLFRVVCKLMPAPLMAHISSVE
jgi:Short-chain dehydrogenases of various substrate specificities